jgi:4-amino-4-deoxy-L-arabinose transferase-like glycosyltransferase
MSVDAQPNWERRAIFLILAIALLVRFGAALLIPDQGVMFPDAASYKLAGQNFWSNKRLDNIYIMPLYPMAVGMVGPGWGQTLFDILASVASVWLVYAISKNIFTDTVIGLVAALMAALYPPLIFYSVLGLSEPLFNMILIATILSLYR